MSWLGWCILAAGVYLVVVLVRGFTQLALTLWESIRESREMRHRMAKYETRHREPKPAPPPTPPAEPPPPVQILAPEDSRDAGSSPPPSAH